MSATSTRSIKVAFSGDVGGTTEIEAAANTDSPASVTVHALLVGDNIITIPTPGTKKAVTIQKPSDHVGFLTLKGIVGDDGIALHPTDPDSISLHDNQLVIVLNATVAVTVRLFWS